MADTRPATSEWTVAEDEAGVTLAKFLASADRLGSRGRGVAAIERGKVFVNGREAVASHAAERLASGDLVRVWMDRPGSSKRRSERAPAGRDDLRIVYEDDVVMVIDKPPGVLSVPLERRSQAVSVVHQLEERFRSRGKRKPLVVHRIDRDTSGLVLFARTTQAQETLKAQFKRHEPDRIYRALVYGHPDPGEGTWRDRLVWDGRALIQKETHPSDPAGKEAVAHYRVIERFSSTSLIEVRLHTGRRNQIRIQARLHGHTLVGETRYTFGPDHLRPIDFARQALHAYRLSFRHPTDGRLLTFESPMPADLVNLIERLRRERRQSRT
jgi:23S rRNA pseudouridine1911/1915/1917 synthase